MSAPTITYEATADQVLFSVPFPYLDKSHVKVVVNGVLVSSASYTWPTSGSVQFTSGKTAGDVVEIYRETPSAPITQYQSGTTVTRDDLANDSLQALYLIEELEWNSLRDDQTITVSVADGATTATLPSPPEGAAIHALFHNGEFLSPDGYTYVEPTISFASAVAAGEVSAVFTTRLKLAADLGGTFLQSGTGAVPRTMQDKARDSVSILDFIPPSEHAAIRAGTSDYDCSAALENAIAATGVNSNLFYIGGPRILFPPGRYYFASTIQLKRTVILEGYGSGLPGGDTTKLEFAPDTGGIIVHRYNTINDTVESPASRGGDASIIRGMLLSGSGTTGHGIWLRARAKLEDIRIDGFGENGLNIVAGAGAGGSVEGNANNWYACIMRITNCGGHGMYVDGADVNAGVAIGIDATSNGRYGIYDSSFLGNTYIACHTANNGVATVGNNPSGSSSFVHFGGTRYSAHPGSTEAAYVATQPGTDANVWVPIVAGDVHPVIPTWTAGQPVGTYFAGGAYRTDNANAHNAFLGCYSESGQGASDFVGPVSVTGGSIYGAGFTRGGYIRGDSGNVLTAKNGGGFAVDGTLIDATLGGNDANGDVLKFQSSADSATSVWRLHRSGADWVWDNAGSGARVAMTFTGENTTLQMGTSVTMPYKAVFPQLAVGTGLYIRRQTTGTAAPTSGEWGKGDVIWNANVAAAGSPGWICTTAGTGGSTAVFKTMAALAA